jgi:hypothetical protein
MSEHKDLIITFFKSKPQGNAILFFLVIKTLIVANDLIDSIRAIFNYPSAIGALIVNIIIGVLLFKILKTPEKMKLLHKDQQSFLVATLKDISKFSFLIFALDVIWFLFSFFVMGWGPGPSLWLGTLPALLSGILAQNISGTALNNPNFMRELELAANPPRQVYLPPSQQIYQQQREIPMQPQIQPEYLPENEVQPIPVVNRCPHCNIETEGENYCGNCGGSLSISK